MSKRECVYWKTFGSSQLEYAVIMMHCFFFIPSMNIIICFVFYSIELIHLRQICECVLFLDACENSVHLHIVYLHKLYTQERWISKPFTQAYRKHLFRVCKETFHENDHNRVSSLCFFCVHSILLLLLLFFSPTSLVLIVLYAWVVFNPECFKMGNFSSPNWSYTLWTFISV